jgi:adenylate kinase family enzyme
MKIKPPYIIIRGPLGIGKSTISKELAKRLKAKRISLDDLLQKNKLDDLDEKEGGIPTKNFIKADNLILDEVKFNLKKGKIIIFDGCFYHKEQIKHLEKNLGKALVFNLKAPLSVCINRDNNRNKTFGQEAAKAVYRLVSKFDYGINIYTNNKTPKETIKEILSYLT